MEEDKDIPTFAVVGKVNMGKTSVLSTLLEQDDNDVLRVSSTPGETTRCHEHVLKVNDKGLIKFIDTPGFSRPLDAMLEIRRFHGEAGSSPGRDAVHHFITHFKDTDEFQDEVLLLTPLLEGVGIIYVIDTSRPLRDSYAAEMEILRWTGCQRLALINEQEESNQQQDWRNKLGSFFNLVRTFNAHRATYGERLHLLKSLLAIDDSNKKQIEETIYAIESNWESRRETSAEMVMEYIQKCLMHHETVSISKRDCENEVRKEKETEKLKKEYLHTISQFQKKCVEKLIKLYKHQYIESEMNDSMFSHLDLEAEETWTKWGLSRKQLAIAGGITGATAGGAVDISTLGATHGFGAILGGVVGLGTAYFKGGALPNFSISLEDLTGNSSTTSTDNEQRKLSIGAPKGENFPWILLDTVLVQYHSILKRSHGRRDKQTLLAGLTERSFVKEMSSSHRSDLTKWFDSCVKEKPDYALEPKVIEAIELAMIEAKAKDV